MWHLLRIYLLLIGYATLGMCDTQTRSALTPSMTSWEHSTLPEVDNVVPLSRAVSRRLLRLAHLGDSHQQRFTKRDHVDLYRVREYRDNAWDEAKRESLIHPPQGPPPAIIYGTAWKEDRTKDLVILALSQGFRAIDTANQPKHYNEEGVGLAIQEALKRKIIPNRACLFLQTKFTHAAGQDPERTPYDRTAPVELQVNQSFTSTLRHLITPYVDVYMLHGPTRRGPTDPLGPADWAAWRAMERFYSLGQARALGVSNVNLVQLRELVEHADVKPRFLQRRWFGNNGRWDAELRAYCQEHDIVFEGFAILKGPNRDIVHGHAVGTVAAQHQKTRPEVMFKFAHQIGAVPIVGTTNEEHMQQDIDAVNDDESFALSESDINHIFGANISEL